MRRCISILILSLLALLRADPAGAATPPPKRDLAEVMTVLAKAPKPQIYRKPRSLNILLVANRKDHGYHEHDYPRWMERWKVLLGGKQAGSAPVTMYGPTAGLPRAGGPGAAGVRVETAKDWPTPEQFQRADLVVAFMGTGGIWNEARIRDLKAHLDRGKGFVALHAAVIAEKPNARPLADLLGLAWEGGTTLFRHGALDLKITDRENPIMRGLPEQIHFEDESYWPLVGDATRVKVLATADEATPGTGKLAPQPMFWTHTVGKGRVFNTILGHYTWTFDDPYFRIPVLRGMAWAAGESPYRFDPLVLVGARVTDGKPVAAKAPEAAPKPPAAAPVAPDAADPNLLLWLDAADRATLTTAPNGSVSAWASKGARVKTRLTSAGGQQPVFVAQGLGSKPAVRFDGNDDVLRDTMFRQSSGEWTVALVVTPRSNAGTFRALLAANRPGVPDFQSGFNIDFGPGASAAFNTVNLEGIKGGGATNLRTESAPFGSGQVLVLSTGAGSSRLWVNGNAEEARGASDALTVMDELRLGGRFYFGGERGYYHGDISEVLIYRTRLSDEQRAGLTAHLVQKYGAEIKPPTQVDIDPWDYLPGYDWAGSRRPLVALDEAVAKAKADPKARKALETRLVEIVADSANTPASRDFACRRLAIIGSTESVPSLARLLGDPALTPMACFALERIPDPQAERALISALGKGPARTRIEVVTALGNRRSPGAIPALSGLLNDSDAHVRGAVVSALGNIGGPAAVAALATTLEHGAPTDKPAAAAALLHAGEKYEAAGRKSDAQAVYDRLARADVAPETRRAAVRATLVLRGAAAAPLLIEQLNSPDAATQAMALLLVQELGVGETAGRELTQAIAGRLKELSPEAQARTIIALADRGYPSAAPGGRAALKSEDAGVRIAALHALRRLGDATDVPALLAAARDSDRDVAAAATSSLAGLPGPGVDPALMAALEQGEPTSRVAAIEALGRRGYAPATPALLRLARNTRGAVRRAVILALGETATATDTGELVRLLVEGDTSSDAQAPAEALTILFSRTEEKDRWADALLAGLAGAKGDAKIALLHTVTVHDSPKVLQALRSAVNDAESEVQDTAVELLAGWETPEPAADLLSIAKSSTNRVHRTQALRGYIRMAGLPVVAPPQRLEMCRSALALAQRDDERRLVLAVLANVPTVEALRVALPFVEREGLADEAGAAAVAIGVKLLPNHAAAVADAMTRVSKSAKSPEVLRQAADLRQLAEQAGR